MFNAGSFVTKPYSNVTLNSTGTFQAEGGQSSEFAFNHTYTVAISNASNLTSGALVIQEFDPETNGWVNAFQDVAVITGGGTPQAVNGNTAAANMVAGGACSNASGISAITANGTFRLSCRGRGFKSRLVASASGGTAVLDATYVGNKFYTG